MGQSVAPAGVAINSQIPPQKFTEPKKKIPSPVDLFGTTLKTGVTAKETAKGAFNGVISGTAIGAVVLAAGYLTESIIKLDKKNSDFTVKEILGTPLEAAKDGFSSLANYIFRSKKYSKDIVENANIRKDIMIKTATDTAAKKYKDVSKKGAQRIIEKAAKKGQKIVKKATTRAQTINENIYSRMGRAIADVLLIPVNLVKGVINNTKVGKITKAATLAAGGAMLIYHIVRSQMNVNIGRHNVDAKLTKTPIVKS